jgi:hypothetical protein
MAWLIVCAAYGTLVQFSCTLFAHAHMSTYSHHHSPLPIHTDHTFLLCCTTDSCLSRWSRGSRTSISGATTANNRIRLTFSFGFGSLCSTLSAYQSTSEIEVVAITTGPITRTNRYRRRSRTNSLRRCLLLLLGWRLGIIIRREVAFATGRFGTKYFKITFGTDPVLFVMGVTRWWVGSRFDCCSWCRRLRPAFETWIFWAKDLELTIVAPPVGLSLHYYYYYVLPLNGKRSKKHCVSVSRVVEAFACPTKFVAVQ